MRAAGRSSLFPSPPALHTSFPLRCSRSSFCVAVVVAVVVVVLNAALVMSNTSTADTWVQQVRDVLAGVPTPWDSRLPASLLAVFDELPYELCLLNTDGIIIFTNAPWRRFGKENGGCVETTDVGVDYLRECFKTDEGHVAGEQVRSVCSGHLLDAVFLEYPCHREGVDEWFVASACRFDTPYDPLIVVTHHSVRRVLTGSHA
jgi:hypothetical protein